MAFAYEIIVLLSYFGFVLCMLWVVRDENGFVKQLEQRNAKVDDTSEEEEEESGEVEDSENAEQSGETDETQEAEKVETEVGVEAKEEEESSTLRQRHVDVITTEL